MASDDKLVYSTHPEIFMKKKEAGEPSSNPGNVLPPLGQAIKVRREKAGRAGKTVTVLFEFQSSHSQMEALAKQLQKFLGTGHHQTRQDRTAGGPAAKGFGQAGATGI